MRRYVLVVVIITMIVFNTSCGLKYATYSEAKQSDRGIYDFFSAILKDSESCLKSFLNEDSNAVNISNNILKRVLLAESEAYFYAKKGVNSNVSYLVRAFKPFVIHLADLTYFQQKFLMEFNSSNYTVARSSLDRMNYDLMEMKTDIKKIESVVLYDNGTPLKFDISNLREMIDEVKSLINYYDKQLPKNYSGIFVCVSKRKVFVGEDVIVFVHARNVKPLNIFIDNEKRNITNSEIKVRFWKTGNHTIYAIGKSGNRTVKSNVVIVKVLRIPTKILVKSKNFAYIGENVKVSGILIDYYGNPLNSSLNVVVKNKIYKFIRIFSINVSKLKEGFLNISVFYEGNETYAPSNSTVSIYFSRYPVSIKIWTNGKVFTVGDNLTVYGSLDGVDFANLYIYVNSKVYKINATKNFRTTIKLDKTGNYTIFAYFSGDSLHKPAKSNVIVVEVKGFEFPYGIAVGSIGLIGMVWWIRKRSRKEIKETEKDEITEDKEDVTVLKSEKPIESYNELFEILCKRFGLSKSLTPRELLNALKDQPFADKLERITELHEIKVYGMMDIDENELRKLIKDIAEELS